MAPVRVWCFSPDFGIGRLRLRILVDDLILAGKQDLKSLELLLCRVRLASPSPFKSV